MADYDKRLLERRALEEGNLTLAERYALRRNLGSAGVDWNSPHTFEVVRGDTYGLALANLRAACAHDEFHPQPFSDGATCPLTFAETIRACVENYNRLQNPDGSERSIEERLLWGDTWLESQTGIAHKKKTNTFRIIPHCEKLRTLDQNFNSACFPCEYNDIKEGEDFNSGSRRYKCNDWLEQDKVLVHPAWRYAAQADTKEFKGYFEEFVGIAFAQFPRIRPGDNSDKGMGFYVVRKPEQDELRALIVNNANNSNANSYYYLSYNARFARVRPQ